MLQEKNVTRKLNEYEEIAALMKAAFPPEECMPMWWLNLLARKRDVRFTAYYDSDVFCGVTYTLETEQMVYLLYLAVSDKICSQGYGSKILSQLKADFPQKELILHVESPDDTADNYEQRIRRIGFYERNHFFRCREKLIINGIEYCIFSARKAENIDEFAKILSAYHIGKIKYD